jgi:hypothetical protein
MFPELNAIGYKVVGGVEYQHIILESPDVNEHTQSLGLVVNIGGLGIVVIPHNAILEAYSRSVLVYICQVEICACE